MTDVQAEAVVAGADQVTPIGRSLGDRAYLTLRRAILELDLRPGEEVSELRLVGQFGLGRAAVRAALARLSHDGLIEVLPRRGHVIAPVTLKGTSDAFELRLIVEPAATRLAAERATANDLAGLHRLNLACALGVGPDALRAQRAANRAFHLAVTAIAANDRLMATLAALLDDLERVLYLPYLAHAMERVVATPGEHDAIIDAIARHDPAAAGDAIVAHIDVNRRTVYDALLGSPEVARINLLPADRRERD